MEQCTLRLGDIFNTHHRKPGLGSGEPFDSSVYIVRSPQSSPPRTSIQRRTQTIINDCVPNINLVIVCRWCSLVFVILTVFLSSASSVVYFFSPFPVHFYCKHSHLMRGGWQKHRQLFSMLSLMLFWFCDCHHRIVVDAFCTSRSSPFDSSCKTIPVCPRTLRVELVQGLSTEHGTLT